MADLLANLPPVPPSLKSIAPYLQRAEELRTQDPIIAYWCKYNHLCRYTTVLTYFTKGAYYAAQIGISLKTRDAASRDLLNSLLGALEQTKNEIGPNDAIYNELASSAYVENFALKVFASADNEDRNAHATRCVPCYNYLFFANKLYTDQLQRSSWLRPTFLKS
jgi:vacuolar protein sorting-associated protein VTA1